MMLMMIRKTKEKKKKRPKSDSFLVSYSLPDSLCYCREVEMNDWQEDEWMLRDPPDTCV